jgi:preprotein translocase subunit SecD
MRYVLFALALLLALPAHAGKTPPKITLRIHVQTTGDGLSENQAQTVYLPPNGEPIQLRALPEVSERNLIAVDPSPGGTLLSFDHQGQINLSAVTAQNQGRILVVFINGYIIYSPVIDEQITSGQLLIPHALAPQVVQLLQDVAQKNVRDASKQ